jgi:predicted dehydrogenase
MTPLDRRDFVRAGATAALGASLAPGAAFGRPPWAPPAKRLRLGFIGVGGRGTGLLGLVLRRDDCEVRAVCDVVSGHAERAARMVKESAGNEPALFTKGEEDWRNLLRRDDLDAVIVATPWLWHAPMAIAAMESGKPVACEVPAALTVEQCWELVETHERTGVPYEMLENVCYRRDVMAVLNMVRQGMFGELVHCRCGYQHDLRGVKFQPGAEFGPGAEGEAVWRSTTRSRGTGTCTRRTGSGPSPSGWT